MTIRSTTISASVVLLLVTSILHPAGSQAVPGKAAVPATDFLNSIGANSAIDQRGETLQHTIGCAKYLGLRWFRSGIEGNPPLQDLIKLHNETGVRFSWSPGSGGSDLAKLLATGRQLAAAGALLAFEGPNEPNNWGITYNGEQGGGRAASWMAVAKLQRDLYSSVKSDPLLKSYPVFGVSECGAETDNVGLQYLTIPNGAGTLMADGTRYADYANVHNYIYHPNSPHVEENKTWNCSDPGPECKVDGLYGECGITWAKHFAGNTGRPLASLPRVTTETGTTIGGEVTEEIHARNLLTLYLDQFARGWSYTAVYLMRDRSDEGGNQQFGFYKPDYTPRQAATYLHNLTTILNDTGRKIHTESLPYLIRDQPVTVHDLLLEKHDGERDLIVWDERVDGTDKISVSLGKSFPEVKICDPTAGAEPVRTLTRVKSVALTLTDHPLIIAIPPSARQ